MVTTETKKVSIDILCLGFFYALVYAALVFFVYPIELSTSGNIITRALGSAFFFGALSGFFAGIIGGIWVNRLNFKSPITAGLVTGLLAAILGSIIFPFVGAFIRISFFGENPSEFILEIFFLINYSLIGVAPGLFVGQIGGVIGGILTGNVGTSV
ncbi:MAG: hypothetical protein ACTSR2_07860 [Candidatus Hodarchaeales archaeon]